MKKIVVRATLVSIALAVCIAVLIIYQRKPKEEVISQGDSKSKIDEGMSVGTVKEAKDADHGKAIHLSDEQIKAGGIELSVAGPGNLSIGTNLPGEVRLNADRLAHIMPRFAGAVKDVRKQIGDRVKKGELLAVIESNESLSSYDVRSLIAGSVIQKHATLGEIIAENSEIFVVADLETVWVDLSIYPRDLAYVQKGQKVEVSAGANGPKASGTIAYVGPLVSENTRTAMARVILPNSDGRWRPGMFVSAKVEVKSFAVPLRIAKDALQTIEGLSAVYVKRADGFRAVPVKLGRDDDTFIEVLSGLQVGDTYVASGAFLLKAEQGKSEGEHDD